MISDNKQRIDYIDRAKAILIILVVLAHVLNYANPQYNILPYTVTQEFITSFHMPAFFLITGLLYKNEAWQEKTWAEFFLRRTYALLIPFLFFETIAILYLHFILHRITLYEGLYRMITLRCNVGADWFLPAMFLATLFYNASVKFPNRFIWSVAAAASFFCTWFLPNGHWWNALSRGLLGFGFIFLGNRAKEYLSYDKPEYGIVAFLLTGILSALSLKFYSNSFYDCVVENPPLFAVCGLTGLYFVFSLSRMFNWKWLQVIGENTLPIMGTHQLVLYTVPNTSSVFWVFGTLLLIIVIESVVVSVLDRFFPFLIGKRKKGLGD